MLLPFSFLVWFLASVSAQGPEPGGEPAEPQYTVVLLTPPMICDDDISPEMFKDNFMIADIHNETSSYMNGNISFTQPITEDITIQLTDIEYFTRIRNKITYVFYITANSRFAELKLIKEENGQAKMMMTTCINICKEMLDQDGDYQFLFKYIMTVGGGCPFEPGAQVISFLVVEMPPDMMKQSNEGCYMASISLYSGACDDKDRVFVGCVYLRFCVEPV